MPACNRYDLSQYLWWCVAHVVGVGVGVAVGLALVSMSTFVSGSMLILVACFQVGISIG